MLAGKPTNWAHIFLQSTSHYIHSTSGYWSRMVFTLGLHMSINPHSHSELNWIDPLWCSSSVVSQSSFVLTGYSNHELAHKYHEQQASRIPFLLLTFIFHFSSISKIINVREPMPNVMAEYKWRPPFNAAMFGWRPLLECHAVMTPTTRVTCSNAAKTQNPLKFVGVPQSPEWISAVSGRSSPYCEDMWGRYCCLTVFSDCRYMP